MSTEQEMPRYKCHKETKMKITICGTEYTLEEVRGWEVINGWQVGPAGERVRIGYGVRIGYDVQICKGVQICDDVRIGDGTTVAEDLLKSKLTGGKHNGRS